MDEAIEEISPKVLGTINLLKLMEELESFPEVFITLSSIIGVTGMDGNASYAFSNEVMDVIMTQFSKKHPDIHVLFF